MMRNKKVAADVDQYISNFPKATQIGLKRLRAVIRKAAPKALEKIGYGMPAYRLDGVLVYFAGYKNHIGFYPGPSAIENFKKNLKSHETSKGTVKLPIDAKIPESLILKMVKYRAKENFAKQKAKKSKKRILG